MAVQESSDSGGRILTQWFRKTQLVKQRKVPKSAAQRDEVVRPTPTIDAHNEFGEHTRIQDSGKRKLENRNWKMAVHLASFAFPFSSFHFPHF
jgi:hypothetical protein